MAEKYIFARLIRIIEQGNKITVSFKVQTGEFINVNEFGTAMQKLNIEKHIGEHTILFDSFPVSKRVIFGRIRDLLKALNTMNYKVAEV